ncbi:SEC23-interacting protein, partial [Fasciola gigantica]
KCHPQTVAFPNKHFLHLLIASYKPAEAYWFYATNVDGNKIWWPFSRHDCYQLEAEAFRSRLPSPVSEDLLATGTAKSTVVPVDGGRYDADVTLRQRVAVYWNEPPSEIRRATWFYRLPDELRVLPFSESSCECLEAQYKMAMESGRWGQPFELPAEDPRGGLDRFIFHSPQSMIQHRTWPHAYGNANIASNPLDRQAPIVPPEPTRLDVHTPTSENDGRVAYVRRGLDEQLLNQLDEGEYRPVDHVFFVVHGIGTIYNLRGQGLVECVNNLRRTVRQIERSHFPHHNNRVEFLPITWHDGLHSDATGIDDQLNQISLRSIPKLRQFTNGTLMDILFYTSSKYCQVIIDTVATEMCRLRKLFLDRNPNFKGGFSVIGHSLGSVIAFDLLSHQGQLSEYSLLDDQSTTTGCGVEDVDFGDHPLLRTEPDPVMNDRLEEVIVADRSGRSSSFGAPNELEGWSLVGYQDSQRQVASETVQPVGLNNTHSETPPAKVQDPASEEQCVEEWGSIAGGGTPRAPSVSTSAEATKLADLLSRIGLTDDQIHKAVRAWLNEPQLDADSTTEKQTKRSRILKQTVDQTRLSFWAENHHAPISAGFGMPVVLYPQLGFPLVGLFMLGSPLPLFLTARGIRQLSSEYRLPQCAMFFNIFHPFDPVAYRMETMFDPTFQPRAVLIPHHKGGKRLHLRLKDNLARVGSDLKSMLFQSMHSTWRTLQDFALSHRCEAPLESFSDYIFALGSHAAYWESEDTALFLLTEAYSSQSVIPLLPREKIVTQKASTSSCVFPHSLSVTAAGPPPPPPISSAAASIGPRPSQPQPPGPLSTSLVPPRVLGSTGDFPILDTTSSAYSEFCSQVTTVESVQSVGTSHSGAVVSPSPGSVHTNTSVDEIPPSTSATASTTPVVLRVPMHSESQIVAPPLLSGKFKFLFLELPLMNSTRVHTCLALPVRCPPRWLDVPPTVSKASQTPVVTAFQAYRHVRPRAPVMPLIGIPPTSIFQPYAATEAFGATGLPQLPNSFSAPTVPSLCEHSATANTGSSVPFSAIPAPWLPPPTLQHPVLLPQNQTLPPASSQQLQLNQGVPHLPVFAPPPPPPPPPPPLLPPFLQPYGVPPSPGTIAPTVPSSLPHQFRHQPPSSS